MGVLDAPTPPLAPWLPSADGIDPALHLDLVGQNFRYKSTKRTLAATLADAVGYFARPSTAWFFSSLGKLSSYIADTPHISWSVPLAAYRGLKIERQSTNMIANSKTSAFGTVSNATVAASPAFGPDGTQSLQRVTGTANGGYVQTSNLSIAAGSGPYTFSAIVPKGATSQTVRLAAITAGGSGGSANIDFDLLTGIVSAAAANVSGVEDLGSFWLAWLTFTPTNDTIVQARFYPGGASATGTADVGWAQVEAGINYTSRIQTTGTAGLRRERDFIAFPASAVFGTGTGTLTVSATIPSGAIERVIAQADDGTESNSIRIRRSSAGNIEVVWTSNGSATTVGLGAHTAGTSTTVTVGWATGALQAIRDGGALSVTAANPPAGLAWLRLGANTTSSSLDGFVTAVSTWTALRTAPFYTAPLGSFVALGDSMAAASGASVNANRWTDLLSAALGRTWFSHGYGGVSSATVLTNWQADPAHWGWTTIIFVGHNFTTTTNPASDIAAMIALMTSEPRVKRFLVVSPLQNSAATVGDAGYNAILALRTALKTAYPKNYVDLYAYLAARGNGGGTDNTDIANGFTPTSLRFDTIHLNDAGQAHEATLYQSELTKRGW